MTEPTAPTFSLLAAARVVAHGGDLDQKLSTLAEHARAVAAAPAATIALHDTESGTVTSPDGSLELPLSDLAGPVAQAIATRRAVWAGDLGGADLSLLAGARRASVIPLVVEEETGQTVEGVLLVGVAEASSGPDHATREALQAIADLSAVAIRQTRLQGALDERGEYHERLARTDPLTGLADRRTFEQMLELELARAARQGTPLAVAVFDVDGFGDINEQRGSAVGDDVLRHVAATLADRVRLIDTVARIGRDEFAVIAPGDAGGVVAVRIRDAVADMPPVEGVRVSVSAGVAHHPDDGATGPELLQATDQAVDRARSQGTGLVVGTRPTGS